MSFGIVVLGQSHKIELRVLGIARVFISLIRGSGTVAIRIVAERSYQAQAEEVRF